MRPEQRLITGAGGSIGAALARQLAMNTKSRLVLLDSSEQNLFRLKQRLAGPNLEFALGSAGDCRLLRHLLQPDAPTLILHAAAYKHVGLLQSNQFAAVENNVFVTDRLLLSAKAHGHCRVLLLSTDKAAAPTSVMGATKRIAELLTLAAGSPVIRLCNVEGTSGSVLPIFKSQLRKGRALTVTHPDARRSFLDVRQAIRYICAASRAEGPLLLAPHLSRSVRIGDLATSLSPGRIEIVGLQAGEKLEEVMLARGERWAAGQVNGLGQIETPQPSATELQAGMSALQAAVSEWDEKAMTAALRRLVPEYQPQ